MNTVNRESMTTVTTTATHEAVVSARDDAAKSTNATLRRQATRPTSGATRMAKIAATASEPVSPAAIVSTKSAIRQAIVSDTNTRTGGCYQSRIFRQAR